MKGEKNESNKENEKEKSFKRSLLKTESLCMKRGKKLTNSINKNSELNPTKVSVGSHFRLQTEKLLRNTEIKNKYKTMLTYWIDNFQIFLNSLPIHDGIQISSLSRETYNRPSRDLRFVKNIANHSKNNLYCDQDIPITFIRPECVGTFGLYKIDALPGPNIEINLHMTIPKKCFNVQDFLNNRYFVKKFFYLMYLAEHLSSQNICSSIKCAYYNENVLLPYLIVCPNSTEKISIRIFLIPQQNYFKSERFSPEVNNVQTQVFKQDVGSIENIEDFPTTFYNTAFTFDLSLAENNIYIEQLFSCSTNSRDGLKLIIIWMNNRKIDTGLGAFSTDLAIYFLVYLISQGKVDENMTADQIFRNFLYFILVIDLTQCPISICENMSKEDLYTYKKYFDIVIMDKTGCYNTAAYLNINAYRKMRHECKLALDASNRKDSFSELFSTNIPIYLQYDAILDVKKENNFEILLETVEPKELVKYAGNHMLLIIKILQEYLKEGFRQRAKNIVPIVPGITKWDYGIRHKISNCRILFGIQLNPEFAFSQSDDTSNKQFNNDSDSTSTAKCRRDIIKTISDHVLTEKLRLNHKLYYNELEDFLKNEKVKTWYPFGTNEETSRRIISSSIELGEKLKSLNLPSRVKDIAAISDVFCYCNLFPPIPTSYISDEKITTLKGHNIVIRDKITNSTTRYVEPVESSIQIVLSSKQTGDPRILQHLRTTFAVKISEVLKKKFNIVSSVSPSYLDILYKGIVFKYHLYFSKRKTLSKSCGKSKDLKIPQEEMLLQMPEEFVQVPKIIEALRGIHAAYPSYGASTCLAKRWIRAQLIDEFLLPDMVINFLNAHQYVQQSLHSAAVSIQAAFLRFLKFLVDVQWDLQPVVINFNNAFSVDEISRVESELQADRNRFPALYIMTPYDDGNSIFTKQAPCKEVLIRLKVLATEFLNLVSNIILEESLYSWKELFIPNRRGFNCILNLKPLFNPRRHEQISKTDTDATLTYDEPNEYIQFMPVINFNPVECYLKELRMLYGDFCVFFHDTYGGSFIGVLWKPGIVVPKEDIKRGFEIVGSDILQSIEMKS